MDSPLWLAVNSIILLLSILNLQAAEPCSPDEYKTLTQAKGRFTSPNFPNYFQKAAKCNWLIKVDPGYVVTLKFEKFEVGHDGECSNRESRTSYVELRDGVDYKNRTIAIFCGSRTPNEISSTGNQMWIRFATSGYRSTKFDAHYSSTKDSSAATIILLASAAIIGTILCISVTIAIVKRKHRDHDDEAGLSPTHDNEAEMDNNRACAVDQLPEFVLLGGISSEKRTNSPNEQRSNVQTNGHVSEHVHNHVDMTDVRLHGQHISGCHDNNAIQKTMGEHNLALTDIDNEDNDILDSLRAPTDANLTEPRRGSHSGSILTSSKVIFVQDSSSSRCSTSSSNNSCKR